MFCSSLLLPQKLLTEPLRSYGKSAYLFGDDLAILRSKALPHGHHFFLPMTFLKRHGFVQFHGKI